MTQRILKTTILVLLALSLSPLALASGSSGGGSAGASGGGAAGVNAVQKSEASSDKVRTAREELRERMQKKQAVTRAEISLPMGGPGEMSAFDHSHRLWARVLKRHVAFNAERTASGFDYKNFDPSSLGAYLASTSVITKAEFDRWSRNQQLAFLINVYNAQTVIRIRASYPVTSIKQLGSGFPFFVSPWKLRFFSLFGEEIYLDKIEHEYVRGTDRYNDPRIHFAFNCASVGCPALLDEPFQAEKLDAQLEQATRSFLKDRGRNRYDGNKNTLYISEIFKWYRGDFEKGHKGYESLRQFLLTHADVLTDSDADAIKLKSGPFEIEYLDYDWSLNDASTVRPFISQRGEL